MAEIKSENSEGSYVKFSDLNSLIERYKSNNPFSDDEGLITAISRLESIQEIFKHITLPDNVKCVCLVGSYSNNDKNRPPRISGKDLSDIDILIYCKNFSNGSKAHSELKTQIINITKQLGKDDIVPLLEFTYINPIELLLPGRYAYKHMLKTATFLAGDHKLFQSKFGKLRDIGLERPAQDISFENWADMH